MTDLSCAFCDRSRTRVKKLIAGKSGNICGSCLAAVGTEPKLNLGKPCVLCDEDVATTGRSGFSASVCKKCAKSSKDIVETLLPGQTWILHANQKPRSCKRQRNEADNKNFYDSSLKHLQTVGVLEDTGDILIDLFESKPSRTVIRYARKWIHQFPNHRQTADVLSFWLKHSPCKETFDLTARYLKRHEPLSELHWLITSIVRGKGSPRLDRLLLERLEQTPQDEIWCRCLHPYKARSAFANRLALRWLKLNEDNPRLLLLSFTFFADSPDVVAAVYKHLRKHGFAKDFIGRELEALLDKAYDFKMSILPSVVKFARNYLSDHAEPEIASHVHAGMLHASGAEADVESAKQWFLSHKSERSSFLVLNALLRREGRNEKKHDPFAVEQAKHLIVSRSLAENPPSLIGTLLRACPDDETIEWAKQTFERTNLDWILIELLLASSDAGLVKQAEKRMPKLIGTSIEPDMLYALLKRNPTNSATKRSAKAWLAKHPRHRWAKAIRSVL